MRKLATSAFSFAAAILISHYLLPHKWLPIICAAAALASLTGLLFHGHVRVRILITLLSLSVGFLWSWAYIEIYVTPLEQIHGKTTTVTAVVKDYPSETTRGYRIDGAISLDSGRPIGARIYYYRETNIEPGDIIEFSARFLRTDGLDGSERIETLSSRGAFIAGYISGEMTVTGSVNRLRYFPQRLAENVANMINRLFDEDVSPFIQALLVGKRDRLNSDTALTSVLSASGISHVVAISGMHISFLMGFLAVIVKNKRLFAFLGIPALLLFMAITGFTPSVTRAGIMQTFLICAPMFRRESDSLTSLSASLFVLLAVNPYSCASVGLQLSFSATLGIILFTSKINAAVTDSMRETGRYKNKAIKAILDFVTSSLATTVGALVFTIPLTAIHFGVVSLISPITNLLTIWAVSLAFPLGIVACVLGYVFFPLGLAVAFPVAYAARYIIFIARTLASIPYSAVYSSNAHIIFWLAYVYILFVTLPLLRARARQYIYPCCLAVMTLCIILFLSPLVPGASGSFVSVLDVGQGQSIVVSSGDNTAVIDCGSSSGENAGFIAHEFLTNLGRTSVDFLVLTHFHSDHVNGVEFLLSRIKVSALCIPDPEDSYIADDIIELARRRGTDIIYVTETLSVQLGDMEIILYPPVGFGDENERGLSILTLGSLSALITGDMDSSGERSLLRFAALPDIDLLIVGHHGSRFSTSEELLTAVTPEIAAISVGRNSYGHPADETLLRLEQYYVTVFRTDQIGHITVRVPYRPV